MRLGVVGRASAEILCESMNAGLTPFLKEDNRPHSLNSGKGAYAAEDRGQ